MRTKKSIINVSVSIISQIIIILLGFFSRRVLIYSVGVQYLGINGLMANILTIFSLAESGIGLAIGYALYKPLANNDIEMIKSLMYFYKWVYRCIACCTVVFGLLFYPFLPLFLKENTAPDVPIIYFMFLFSSVASYLWSYKTTINSSDQNKYLYTIANTITQIWVLIIKMCVLYFTENYVLYLAIDIGATVLKNIVFSRIIDKQYPFLKEKDAKKLPYDVKKKLIDNVKSLFLTKIGYIISQSSDNLVTSAIVNITAVGLYSNYTTLISSITGFVSTFTGGVTASMGNLIATEDKNYAFIVFKRIDYLNYLLYSFSAICLWCLTEPFIILWLGEDYILSKWVLLLSIILFYLKGINSAIDVVKNAAGLFRADKYITIIEAIINIIISIVLAREIGIEGVLLGTIISYIGCSFWVRPYFVYKNIFDVPIIIYFKDQLQKMTMLIFFCTIMYYLEQKIFGGYSGIGGFIMKTIFIVISSSILLVVSSIRKDEFVFIKEFIKSTFEQMKKKDMDRR